MNRRKEEKKIRLAVELGEQYGEILRALSRMPKETKAHRDARWKWFRTHPEYEQMFGKTMEAYSPSGYRLMVRCKGSGDLSGMSSRENKEIGSEEFLLAVKETVEEYTEEKAETGKEGSFFVACVGQKYRQNMQRACGAERYDHGGPVQEIPYDRKYQVIKYVYEIKRMMETGKIREYPEFWEARRKEICASRDWKLTKKEWDALVQMVYDMNRLVSMDKNIGDEEDGTTLGDILRDPSEGTEEKAERTVRETLLGTFIRNMAQDWKYVKCGTNKRSREWIRIFLTKDLLIALKLDSMPEFSDHERKQWEDCRPEPYCGQWCPARKTCGRDKRTGCYMRYQTKPAGNEGIYRILSPHADVIFRDLLTRAYVGRAVEGEPEELYEVYEHFLREDFDFRDRILGEVLHKDKSAVSRARSEYEGKVRERLFRQFLEEQEN